ncbi:hypothetical protein H5410_056119 [Solanum commersonii]|uniref:Uncharacterized protein n=1 Tax=Solanum commersonii TaxID=4109 RepID=A0A9J5WJE1_SOLCO|nr:hypothetical protein H5410_056119 [Solanum commersonii]
MDSHIFRLVLSLITSLDSWFEWTERGSNFFRRISLKRKTLEWIVRFFERHLSSEEMVLEGGKKESFSETFCARNLNNFGCVISALSIFGVRRRAVLIIPEITFNAGWNLIAADKIGGKNTKFFQRIAISHKRYNTIDRLKVEDEVVVQMPEIKRTMVDLYMRLYLETGSWRPSFEFPDCPKVNDEESEWL